MNPLHEQMAPAQPGFGVLSRVGLGAAQFGMPYGRFNVDGVPSLASLCEILDAARGYGLTAVDTAHLYGGSEAALGRCGAHLAPFEVVTKTPRFSDDAITRDDAQVLRDAFEASLRALHLSTAGGLMIHHAPNLLAPGGEWLYQEMMSLKREGKVKQIGVSVYSGEIAEEIHDKFPVDLVQLPINVLDQRAINSGALSRLAGAGVKVQARSAFLQGLLLAAPATVAPHFDTVKPLLVKFHEAARAAGIIPAHAALQFLLAIKDIDRVVVGVDSVKQLDQLFKSFPAAAGIDFSPFSVDQPEILNPALWVS